jgi:hypothetical protein
MMHHLIFNIHSSNTSNPLFPSQKKLGVLKLFKFGPPLQPTSDIILLNYQTTDVINNYGIVVFILILRFIL